MRPEFEQSAGLIHIAQSIPWHSCIQAHHSASSCPNDHDLQVLPANSESADLRILNKASR